MDEPNCQAIRVNGVQYRQQYRKCGKPGCHCNTGEGHGPYWYGYDGNSAAKYVGVQLPEHVTKHVALLKASREKLKGIKVKISKRRDDLYESYRKADRELSAVRALEAGERVDSKMLVSLGLGQFNGTGSK